MTCSLMKWIDNMALATPRALISSGRANTLLLPSYMNCDQRDAGTLTFRGGHAAEWDRQTAPSPPPPPCPCTLSAVRRVL